jgi:hypothetical protein
VLADPLSHRAAEEEPMSPALRGSPAVSDRLVVLEVLEDVEFHVFPPIVEMLVRPLLDQV